MVFMHYLVKTITPYPCQILIQYSPQLERLFPTITQLRPLNYQASYLLIFFGWLYLVSILPHNTDTTFCITLGVAANINSDCVDTSSDSGTSSIVVSGLSLKNETLKFV